VIGSVFESYRVLSKLGGGGMGEVYVAEHTGFGKHVAIKVLRPEYAANPEILQRFYNEARAVTLVGHEAIVNVEHFGKQPSGAPFLAMELLRGESLGEHLRRKRRLAPELVAFLGWLIAEPVGAAHARGIIHRDLKPDNVFLVAERLSPFGMRVKILDFGIAKLLEEGGSASTRPQLMVGTPTYMSPEQCRGAGGVDQRSDVYSLGCILYEAVTGRAPFVVEGKGALLSAHMHLEPQPPTRVEPSVPRPLEAIILRMLAKERDARYQTMADVSAELESFWRDSTVHGPPMRLLPERRPLAAPALETPAPGETELPAGDHESSVAPTSLRNADSLPRDVARGARHHSKLLLGSAAAVCLLVLVIRATGGSWRPRPQVTRGVPTPSVDFVAASVASSTQVTPAAPSSVSSAATEWPTAGSRAPSPSHASRPRSSPRLRSVAVPAAPSANPASEKRHEPTARSLDPDRILSL
jgi:eukaryotic-like serine/threonine-protein kinase